MGPFVLWEKKLYCEKSTLVLLFSSLRPFKKSLFFFFSSATVSTESQYEWETEWHWIESAFYFLLHTTYYYDTTLLHTLNE